MSKIQFITCFDAKTDNNALVFDSPVNIMRVTHKGGFQVVLLCTVDKVTCVSFVAVVAEAFQLEKFVLVAFCIFIDFIPSFLVLVLRDMVICYGWNVLACKLVLLDKPISLIGSYIVIVY